MDRVHGLLRESISCYREMLAVYARVRENVAAGGSAETLESLLLMMQALSRRAHYADAGFQEILIGGAPLGKIPLLSEWKLLITRVREENLQIQQYIKAAMAMIQEDLSRLKKGKQALSAYRSGSDGRGRRINVFSG